jgi:two-component system phosphate regulon sensor histidine kinase PhoR
MSLVLSLLRYTGYFDAPQGAVGWAIWLAGGVVIVLMLINWRGYRPPWDERSPVIFAGLLVLVPVTSLFLGTELPINSTQQMPEISVTPEGSLMMFFLAVPWVISAGLLGPVPTVALAGISGVLVAYFNSHNPFIPLIYAFAGLLFSSSLHQNYRTLVFRLMSHPLVAGVLVSLVYPVLYLFTNLVSARGLVGARLDYGLSHVTAASLAFGGQLLIASVIAEIISLVWTNFWEHKKTLKPSPAESSLEIRLMYTLTPVVSLIMLAILVGQWVSISRTTQRLLGSQLENITEATADSIPVALETGQNLINQFAQDQRAAAAETPEEFTSLLAEYLNQVPFFNQLMFFDENQELVAGYPVSDYTGLSLTREELDGIDLALKNVAFQSFSMLPDSNSTMARIVFISGVRKDEGGFRGVLIGRTSLDQNPFFKPTIENLAVIQEIGGVGMLLDEVGMILLHPDPELIGTYFSEKVSIFEEFRDLNYTAIDGTREMLFVQPVPGSMWAMVSSVPSAQVQQAALNSVLPLIGLMILLLVVGYGLLRFGLGVVVGSIRELAEEARLISEGDLDRPLEAKTLDEVGQLSVALEEMRIGLKARVEEANRLLTVSKGVASALEMEAAVNPILEGVLTTGASSARLVLTEAALPEYGKNMSTEFSRGPSAELYSDLDRQILSLNRQRPEIILTNPARARLDNFGRQLPGSLVAMALRHEGEHYGSLWVAYDEPKRFNEDEIRFLSTVAGQAALAAANTRLYLSAELGRQRMEAILASTSDPVLVTDYQDNLLIINPAAGELLGASDVQLQGRPVREVITERALQGLLLRDPNGSDRSPVEIMFRDGRVFYTTASPILVDDKPMGRVCMLRDITHYKELDALKSEFVDTVSHDLRSPLTLMRGHATMVQMVGELNNQQTEYIQKIVQGVESMSRLVNNLLDLGRIEVGVGLRLEKVPAEDVLKQVAEALRLTAVQKQIGLEISMPEDGASMVQVDRALLEQALYNLIDNAIKFTDTGGKVEVSFKREEDQVAFVIKDNGIGIAPVDQPRLFERFYRVSGWQTATERGSGLGLAIVKSIAERHGGRIRVDSKLGRGSTFTLSIPIRQQE